MKCLTKNCEREVTKTAGRCGVCSQAVIDLIDSVLAQEQAAVYEEISDFLRLLRDMVERTQ